MAEPFAGGIVSPLEWLNGLLPWLPGAAPDAVKHELMIVLRDFFSYSSAWTSWVGPVLLHPDTAEYAIETGDVKSEAVTTFRAQRESDKSYLTAARANQLGPTALAERGEYPVQFFNPTPQTITFLPLQDRDNGERVHLFISHQPIDLDIPDRFRGDHYETIRNGVLARIHRLTGPNYKPDLAREYSRLYLQQRTRARITAEASFGPTSNMVRPIVPFVRNTRQGARRGATPW